MKPAPVIDLTPDLFGSPARSKFLRRLLAQTRNRARRSNIAFTLESNHAERMFEQQEGRCAVTGITFHLERFADALVKHPFSPSIDRILSKLENGSKGGYIEGNVRLVCVGVNFGMGQWGQELYMRLARAAVAQENEPVKPNVPAESGDWFAKQGERIAAAERVLTLVPAGERAAQVSHIAGLKAALRLGPSGLSARAEAAARSRRAHRK